MSYTRIVDLRVNYQLEPIEIETFPPKFSWRMESDIIGRAQSAYRITVCTGSVMVWDSGRIESGLSVGIVYGGESLKMATRYFWTVTIWDDDGTKYTTAPSYFETGVTEDKEWIATPFIRSSMTSDAAPIFRTEGAIKGKIRNARLYISAAGVYDAYINGRKTHYHMAPGYGNGKLSIRYQTYDVTDFITDDKFALVIQAGTGWYNIDGEEMLDKTTSHPAIKAMLRIDYGESEQITISTNTSDWKVTHDGPVTACGVFYGEDYDARNEKALGNYKSPGYDDSKWSDKLITCQYPGKIISDSATSGKIVDEFCPISAVIYTDTVADSKYPGGEIAVNSSYTDICSATLKKGQTMIVNTGQNISAVPLIQFKGIPGKTVTMKFGEMLNDGSTVGDGATQADGPKGTMYKKSLRSARSEARYTFASNETETYQPQMTFFGYQYIEISADCDIVIYSIKSLALSSVCRQTGFIKTNNEHINRLFKNALYGQLSNSFTTLTDCPQRDERRAWTGDAQAFAQTAVYNFDAMAFMNGYQQTLSEATMAQGFPGSVVALWDYFNHWATGWSDVQIINPWVMYNQTGDISVLSENFDAMNRYMEYLKGHERSKYCAPGIERNTFGDWLAFQGTGYEVIADYYYGYVTMLMAKISEILGDKGHEKCYGDYFNKLKETFLTNHVEYNDTLVIKSGTGNPVMQNKGGPYEDNSQTALLWMLKLGYYGSDEMRNEAIRLLVENIKNENPNPESVRADYGKNTLSVGFLGSNIIAPVLTDEGYSDVSYDLLLSTEMPSWLFEVKAGATTIWERWNSYSPDSGFGDCEMNSFNHFAYGSIVEWMYRYMVGICSDKRVPGFKHILLHPTPDTGKKYNDEERINKVRGEYHSYYGKIVSEWSAENGKLTRYHAEIPANTTATLYLPVGDEIRNFSPIEGVVYYGITLHNGIKTAEFALKSGSYDFVVSSGAVYVNCLSE